MTADRILITGGAGFIGSHLADALVAAGKTVRIVDLLVNQVHGSDRRRPGYLSPEAELIVADAGDPEVMRSALEGIDTVVHLAATVGVGQSMYEIAHYVSANTQATANLLQVLSERHHEIRKLVIASSMSIYGEGAYRCRSCGPCAPPLRPVAQLEARRWEVACPSCGGVAEPVPTSEDKPLSPTSVYAITKRDQEELCLCVGRAYGIPTVALRYFNVYGERQALSNPYTGVAAIFSARLLNDHPPLVYEDGRQTRDFTHVSDIVRATILAIERPEAHDRVFNVGTGQATSVAEVAAVLAESLGKRVGSQITQTFRAGDIRHCVADVTRISATLGYRARVSFAEGMRALALWVRDQRARDAVDQADALLRRRGLVT